MMKKVYLVLTMLLGLCTTVTAQNNWMQYLPDNAYVVDVSIPGTHDTATGNGWTGLGTLGGPTNGTTQDLTFEKQWAAGVRAFDFRPKIYGSRLAGYHGILQTKLYFDDAIKSLCAWLDANPTEFAVMHILYSETYDKDKAKYQTMLSALLNTDGVKEHLVDFRADLTVKDMRGKLLILSRDQYDTTPYTGGFLTNWCGWIDWNVQKEGRIVGKSSSASLYMQDFSSTKGDKEAKDNAVRAMLNFSTKHIANTASDIVWVYNFASAYIDNGTSTSNGYRANAVNTHATILDYLSTHSAGPTGIILMDYAGVDKSGNYNTRGLELVNTLIENNWKYLPKMSENKTVSVPFYAYKTTGWTCTTGNTFRVNTSSTEGVTDGSGMVTPFFENKVSKGSKLGNGEIFYTLSECKKGYYKVTIQTRLLNEAGGEISGASIFANESSINLTNGKSCTNGFCSNYSVVGTVDESGELKFGFKIEDATFNWLSFTGVEVEYIGEAVTEEVGGDLINAVCEKAVKETYNETLAAFKETPSAETYNEMSEAYHNAEISIEAYKKLAEALEYADNASRNVAEESKGEYDNVISEIRGKYNDGEYTATEIEESVIPQVYAALAALLSSQAIGEIDMTPLIVNNSFETGDMTGWSVPYASSDTGVRLQFNATYTTSGCDGDYLFNTWWQGVPITQTVKGLPNGKYRLDVLVASDGATIYLIANGGHNEGTESGGDYPSSDKFQEASYEFLVTDGTATIGVVGSAKGSDVPGEHKPYDENGYWWYKADNFRLSCIEPNLSFVALPFSGEGDVEAGKWYAYDVATAGYYDFSTVEGIEITTVDALMSEVTSKPMSGTTVSLSVGALYFKSAEAKSLTISRQTDAVAIPESEYAAYVTKFDVDFTLTEGVTAYKVTTATKYGTILEPVTAAKAGTAVILSGETNDYTIQQATAAVATINDNLLKTGGDKAADGTSVYVLGAKEEEVGFCLAEEGTVIADDQCYLEVENTDAIDFIPFGMLTDIVAIPESEYAAYVTKFDVDFTLTEGITAYKVTVALSDSTKIEAVEVAPAGTAVILKGVADDYTIKATADAVESVADNLFLPGGTQTGDGTSIYVLDNVDGEVGFYLVETGALVAADQGYLLVENTADIPTFIPIGRRAIDTGIEAVDAEDNENAVIYNLSGQRVVNPAKGVYIVNGKKVLVK